MADKLPYFPFYADDWLSDEKLRACSLEARGLWIDLLSLMHKNDRRGYLQLNGKLVSAAQIARMVGCATDEASRALAELLNAGVPSVQPDGVIFSRRMTRDERIRQERSEAGKKGVEAKRQSEGRKGKRSFAQAKVPANGQQKGSTPSSSESESDPSGGKPPDPLLPPAAAKAKSQPRPRDELFDAIVEVTGADPKLNGSQIGRVCKTLRQSDPSYTPAEVRSLASALAAHGYDFPLTVAVVGKWIYLVRLKIHPPPRRKGGQEDFFAGLKAFARNHQEGSNGDGIGVCADHGLPQLGGGQAGGAESG